MTSQVTVLLQKWQQGDPKAFHELMPLVYDELHRVAQSILRGRRPGQTLQPTALVNEACVKLLDHSIPTFVDKAHFMALLSRVMRQVLVDHARAASTEKRGGQEKRVDWDTNIEVADKSGAQSVKMLELDRALDALQASNPALARIVEMHYFGGMTAEEAALVTGRSPHAIRHDLRAARAWLRRELAT